MTLIPSSATIHSGQVVALKARLFDEFGDPMNESVSWKSSNDVVATVAAGEVYGRSEGHALITATALGKSQVATIKVLRRGPKPDPDPPLALTRAR